MRTKQERVQNAAPSVFGCLCGKWYSPTRNAARALRREIADYNGCDNPVRFYECEHGGWHWTQDLQGRWS